MDNKPAGGDEELRLRIAELSAQGAYLQIVALLEHAHLDYALTLELARACINAYSQDAGDAARDLLEYAIELLDTQAAAGRDDPQWLLVRGCALFRQGLIADAQLRFDHALQHVSVGRGDQQLLATLARLHRICQVLERNREARDACEKDLRLYTAHLEHYFGPLEPVRGGWGGVELLLARSLPQRSYQLLISRGLSCRRFCPPAPAGEVQAANAAEAVELCLAVPAAAEGLFSAGRCPYQLRLMYDLLTHILSSESYVGFGFCFDRGQPLDAKTKFQGAMLTAPGDFSPDCAAFVSDERVLITILQIIPLYAAELEFRRRHSAGALLELFKLRRVNLSPTLEGRPCVVEAAQHRGGEVAARGGEAAQ